MVDHNASARHLRRMRAARYALVPLLQIIASFTLTSAALTTALPTARIDELVDFGVTVVFRRRDHGNRQFPLCAITRFHDLADAQAAVMSGDVRLLTIS